jgi:ABC-type Fe3+/spermidine/putrescine transport system ATPase subunit
VLNGRPVYSSSRRIDVPVERRGLSMVFQSYAIWPHMTVAENVGYGLRVRGVPKAELREKVGRALELVQMQAFDSRQASKLSGGQQQRVAVARAIAFSPSVILFDEPLSNLDAKLRNEMRGELKHLLSSLSMTAVYVTHDQEEALAMSDRIVVMNAGRIEQSGTPGEIYDQPRTPFVAQFIGSANMLAGSVVAREGDRVRFRIDADIEIAAVAGPIGGTPNTVAIQSAYLDFDRGDGMDLNRFAGVVREKVFHGDFLEYVVDTAAGTLRVKRPPGDRVHAGDTVVLTAPVAKTVLLAG